MLAALLLAASGLPPAADPAPLPDRWLLKLLPADLPPTPDRLHAVTWYDDHPNRNLDRSWALWVEFRADGKRPAQAVLTLAGGTAFDPPLGPQPGGNWPVRPFTAPGRRAVPLAVHGPLVEFDRRLYTATAGVRKFGRKDTPDRELLHLGSAVELKGRVWYQAGTRTLEDGKTAVVEEWRVEFEKDPRTAAEGTAMVRGHRRVLAEPDGEAVAAEVRFKAEGPDDRTEARVVTFLPPDGKKPARKLPYLVIGNGKGQASVIWLDGQDRLTLSPARSEAPRRGAAAVPGLVQPPSKKPEK